MAGTPLNTTNWKGSHNIKTTDDGEDPQYCINGIPLNVTGSDNIIEVNSNYLADITDDIIICTGSFTVTLPLLANAIKVVIIKSVSGTITVDGNGSTVEEPTALTTGQANEFTPTSAQWRQV